MIHFSIRNARNAWFLWFAPVMLGTPIFAQSDTSKIQLSSQKLSDVVVQATRTDENSPVPHTNFTSAKLTGQYHAQDVPYLLSSVPSLVETSDGGTGVGYTGLRIRGSDPTRINVTINGLPLNDAESQGVYWVDLPDLVSSASEIQVQRGVGSSTNGAGSFGASVNLNLSKVEPDPFAIVSNTLGAFGTRKHTLQAGTGLLNGKLAFTARISGLYSDGYVDRASVNLNAFHLRGAYLDERQTFQFHLLSGHEITYQAWNGLPAQYIDNEELRTFNSAGIEQPQTPYPNQVDDYSQRHFLAHYKRTFSPQLQLQLNGHYTQGFGYYEQYKANQNLPDYGLPLGGIIDTVNAPTDLVRRLWLDNDFYGGTFALKWQPGGSWNPSCLLSGAWSKYTGQHFGKVIWSKSFTGANPDYQYYFNEATKQDANVFLKVEANPLNRLTTFFDLQWRGIQYDFLGFDRDFNNVQQQSSLQFFNPKIGLNYSFSKEFSLYSFLGVGHREPNRDDYTQSTVLSRPRAEQLLDFETGLRGKGKNWTASINFFWMNYKNQLVLDGRINDVGAYIRTNVPESWRTGLELESAVQLGNFVQLTGSAALSQNKISKFIEYRDNWDTGAQEAITYKNTDIAFSPNFIARGEATFQVIKTKAQTFSSTLVGKYVSKQFLDNTSNASTSLPGYLVCDLRFNYDLSKWIGKQTSLIFSINNLLNKKYASNGWAYRYISSGYDARPDDAYTRLENGDVYHQAGYFPQAGINWMATLRVAF